MQITTPDVTAHCYIPFIQVALHVNSYKHESGSVQYPSF